MITLYKKILTGLSIVQEGTEKNPNVSLKSSILIKKGLKIKKLEEIREIRRSLLNVLYITFQHGYWSIRFSPKKGGYT